jgi:hypothetical protein
LGNRGNYWGSGDPPNLLFCAEENGRKAASPAEDHFPMLQRMSDTAVLTVVSALYAIAVFVLKRRHI